MKPAIVTLSMLLVIIVGCNSINTRKKVEFITEIDTLKDNSSTIVTDANNHSDSTHIKCNEYIILETQANINALSLDQLIRFLATFSIDRNTNVEFSEFSNEVLFSVIYQQPHLFLEALCRMDKNIEYKQIYKEIMYPIHDLIPIDSIYCKINSLNNQCDQLDSIKKYLQIAVEKF